MFLSDAAKYVLMTQNSVSIPTKRAQSAPLSCRTFSRSVSLKQPMFLLETTTSVGSVSSPGSQSSPTSPS